MNAETIFYQLFEQESSTYTYLIADPATKEAALIDSVIETMDRDLKLIDELGLKLKYVLDTHVHADHITAAGEIRKRSGAQSAISEGAHVECADLILKDGQELFLGNKKIKVLATPGHTDSCLSFLFEDRVFTGDALLIRGNGRTDFQQGSADKLYESIHQKLFKLPDTTQVYPCHDYKGQTKSSIGLEKKFNPRVGMNKTKSEFVKVMSELKLADPKKIHEAVPANMSCGKISKSPALAPTINDGVPEVTVTEVHAVLGKVRLIDVRRADEFNGELGHIQGAELVTLGPNLMQFLEDGDRSQEIVFVCLSGGRSGQAASVSQRLGYKHTSNMLGGMIGWHEARLPVERS